MWRSGFPRGLRAGVDLGGEYSREVLQQVRIWRDVDTRSGTVTCGDGRRWTGCLLFASRGSGVRVPLAPQVRGIIRTASPRVQQHSTAVGTAGVTAHAFELGLLLAGGGAQILGLGPRSGPLSRKNVIVGSCSPVRRPSGECAESAVSGPVLAAHAEGQRMAGFPVNQGDIFVALHKCATRMSPNRSGLKCAWRGCSPGSIVVHRGYESQGTVIPEGAGPCQRGFCGVLTAWRACVTGVSCFLVAAISVASGRGRSGTGRSPAASGGAGGVLEVTGRSPR